MIKDHFQFNAQQMIAIFTSLMATGHLEGNTILSISVNLISNVDLTF